MTVGNSPTPITFERQHEQHLSVLDKLAAKDNQTSEEEKYAEFLMTLIEAYEEEHHSIPDASPVEVLRTLVNANGLRQKDLVQGATEDSGLLLHEPHSSPPPTGLGRTPGHRSVQSFEGASAPGTRRTLRLRSEWSPEVFST